MNIHKLYGVISPHFRKKRFKKFMEMMKPNPTDRILDVGGSHPIWTSSPRVAESVLLINIGEYASNIPQEHTEYVRFQKADACALPFEDNSFDIGFSNSVIEHVGTWENQQLFASEIRRTCKKLWVQTPARSFFIEPHYIAFFIHWFPIPIRRKLARWGTLWGWMTRPTPEQIEERLNEIRLLSRTELQKLFPDCEIITEKFLGLFTKSYTACRIP